MVEKRESNELGFNIIVTVATVLIFLIIFYPLWYILISSFSSGAAISKGLVVFLPVDITLDGYKEILSHALLPRSFVNTIGYTISGTTIDVILTVITAYALSRKGLVGRRGIGIFFAFTMWFNAGLIPTFLHYKSIGLVNSPLAIILPGAILITNMVIVRAYFENSIPMELLEAAKLDGCSDIKYLLTIAIPLAKPIIAVVTLYYAVIHWNQFFNAMIYIQDIELYPLQLVLRDILLTGESTSDMASLTAEDILIRENLRQMLKYSVIVASSLPMLLFYPFIQKYFQKGLSAGAVKG